VANQGANSIKTVFNERISETKGLALNPSIIKAVKLSNDSFAGLSPEDVKNRINEIDKNWIKEKKKSNVAQQIHFNPISEYLRKYVSVEPEKYGEIFVINAFGTNVGCTKILSDYFQADESWWLNSFDNGKGNVFIDDRGYDESVKTLVTGIVVPIMDDGKAIGVLKINFKIRHVLDLVSTLEQSKLYTVSLARSLGGIIISSDENRGGVSDSEQKVMKMNNSSGWVSDYHQGEKMIMGFAPVDLKINTRVPTAGEIKGVSGEVWKPVTWYVFVDLSEKIAFSPVQALKQKNYIIQGIIVLLAILVASYLSKSIIHPIQILQRGAEKIQFGNFDHEISLSTGDELEHLAASLNSMASSLIHANITLEDEVKKRTLELEKRNKDLDQSNKDLQQFAYVASHDLQEPLRMVASYTQLLSERYKEKLDDKADKYIFYAIDGATRMQALIQDLLSFSRVNTHGVKFENIDLNKILKTVLKQLEVKISETNAKIEVSDLPVINGDSSQIIQVFQNLISNAIKFCDDIQPEISIYSAKEKTQWHLSVADNGIGIEDSYKDKIFIIFQRLHTRKEYPGTGIGLAVCKRIIERHGGQIWFKSGMAKGTVFTFSIPV